MRLRLDGDGILTTFLAVALDVVPMACRLRDMSTTRKSTQLPPGTAIYTIRVDRVTLDRLHEIAATEHRTLAQKIRVMFEDEVAAHEPEQQAA